MPGTNNQLDALFHAIADPTRRRLIETLVQQPGLTTAQLADSVRGMTRWGVMKHLDVLADAGVIQTLPEGRRRRHYVERATLVPLRDWLDSV
jgi:DNA-binding transcriptional ArsR family regulator